MRCYYVLEWFIISINGIGKGLLICATCLDDKYVKALCKVTTPMQMIIDTVMYAFICGILMYKYR